MKHNGRSGNGRSPHYGAYRRPEELAAQRRRKRRRLAYTRQIITQDAEAAIVAAEPVGWGRKGRDGRVRPGGAGPS